MIKRFNPDFSLSISHELAYMRETPEGGYVAQGDYATLFSELEVVKAERDALERQLSMSEAKCKGYFSDAAAALIKCDALAVENAGFKHALSVILEHVDVTEKGQAGVVAMIANDELFNSETPATDAALAAIEARFCGLLDHYGKVEPEQFNPEFADLYAKIVNRIFSSVMDNPSVTDLESLTDYLESSAENSRAYADMSMKFHAELRESK